MGIPEKPNAESGMNPNGIPGWSRTPLERSDAGTSIVQEKPIRSDWIRSEEWARDSVIIKRPMLDEGKVKTMSRKDAKFAKQAIVRAGEDRGGLTGPLRCQP